MRKVGVISFGIPNSDMNGTNHRGTRSVSLEYVGIILANVEKLFECSFDIEVGTYSLDPERVTLFTKTTTVTVYISSLIPIKRSRLADLTAFEPIRHIAWVPLKVSLLIGVYKSLHVF